MAFLIDAAFLPATLTVPPVTDEQFAEFCAEHPDHFFEMTAEGTLFVSPPSSTLTGSQNSEIHWQLRSWAKLDKRGIANDSPTGYVLPRGARRSPDAFWVLKAKIRELSQKHFETYWHLCPDFVIELRSKSDRTRPLSEKMREWLLSGAQVGWLIDPESSTVEIYRPGREPEVLAGVD